MNKLTIFLFVALVSLARIVNSQSIPVLFSGSDTQIVTVTPEQTSAEIAFQVDHWDGAMFRAIVPVSGTTLSVIDATGATVLTSADARVSYFAGADLTPPLPGGQFFTETIPAPNNGKWILRFNFPSTPDKTVILATILHKSQYEANIALAGTEFLTGETAVLGLLVTNNGTPIIGLSPTIAITPQSGGAGVTLMGKDDGVNGDGKANDGLYSVVNTFTAPGMYDVVGTATFSTPTGNVTREARTTVDVRDPAVTVASAVVEPSLATSGCVDTLNVRMVLSTSLPGTYLVSTNLVGDNGESLSKGDMFDLGADEQTVTLSFPLDSIREEIGTAHSYTVDWARGFQSTTQGIARVFEKSPVGSYTAGNLCVDPIVLTPNLTVAPSYQGSLISALTFRFQITASTSGTYEISLKITGENDELIDSVSLTEALNAGTNTVTFTIPGEKFSKVDGPYHVGAVLVVGDNGASKTLFELGQTDAYLHTQFVGQTGGGKTFTGPDATGTGTTTVTFTGGGDNCAFDPAQTAFVKVTGTPPTGVGFPHGLFHFRLTGCEAGSTVMLKMQWPAPITNAYWKYNAATDQWYVLPGATFNAATSTWTFTVTDNGPLDADSTPGVILDPSGPANAATDIPTLQEWLLVLLSLLLAAGLFNARVLCRPVAGRS